MVKVSAVIMAAGSSQRMGRNKLHLPYRGSSFIEQLFDLTAALPFYERILVISPANGATLKIPEGLRVVTNRQAFLGQQLSVRLGTAAASGSGYLFLPVDQPLLTAALLQELWPYYDEEHIVFPTASGQPSSPVYFGKRFRQELLAVSGVGGGRSVRQAHPEACRQIPVSCPEQLTDIDTPQAYQALLEQRLPELDPLRKVIKKGEKG